MQILFVLSHSNLIVYIFPYTILMNNYVYRCNMRAHTYTHKSNYFAIGDM